MSLTVADLMTPNPVTVLPETTATEVRAIMHRLRCRHVPVVDAHGALMGVVHDSDLLTALIHDPADPTDDAFDDKRAVDVMTWAIEAIPPYMTLADAGHRMLDRKVTCLPVVDQGVVIGVLTEADFLRAAVTLLDAGVEEEEALAEQREG